MLVSGLYELNVVGSVGGAVRRLSTMVAKSDGSAVARLDAGRRRGRHSPASE